MAALGFFKSRLSAGDKRELLGLIADFARGLAPLIVPITLINHYVTRLGIAYMADQIYLSPYSKELLPKNHTRGDGDRYHISH
jgi:uncharacterized protein YbgA (DUF1722 family)